jgi:hypothetical protein
MVQDSEQPRPQACISIMATYPVSLAKISEKISGFPP